MAKLTNKGYAYRRVKTKRDDGTFYKSITTADDIAIVGMVGRFPGADNLDQFWENLYHGHESISIFH